MRVEEIFFRDMYRQICLLRGKKIVSEVDPNKMFDFPPDEKFDGLLTYGCIDGETFVFEILAGVQISGNRVKMFPLQYKKSVQLKLGQVEDADLKIVTEEYSLPFRDKIQIINDRISVDAAREQTRFIKNLDAFRHPHYPDDVAVYFLAENFNPEQLWVRCKSIDENILAGELLNEPNQNFNLHAGDLIKFGVAQVNGQDILLWLPTL